MVTELTEQLSLQGNKKSKRFEPRRTIYNEIMLRFWLFHNAYLKYLQNVNERNFERFIYSYILHKNSCKSSAFWRYGGSVIDLRLTYRGTRQKDRDIRGGTF